MRMDDIKKFMSDHCDLNSFGNMFGGASKHVQEEQPEWIPFVQSQNHVFETVLIEN